MWGADYPNGKNWQEIREPVAENPHVRPLVVFIPLRDRGKPTSETEVTVIEHHRRKKEKVKLNTN